MATKYLYKILMSADFKNQIKSNNWFCLTIFVRFSSNTDSNSFDQ